MKAEYKIPIQFKPGRYVFSEITTSNGNALILIHENFGILSYSVSENGIKVRIYNIIENSLLNCLYANYNDEGWLETVDIICDGAEKLVFINYIDDADARNKILDIAKENANFISDELIKIKEKVARLFIEYNRDDECFSFAAKLNTNKDVQKVDSNSWDINTSGNYPNNNRIDCNANIISVMLLCAQKTIRFELIDMIIKTMIEIIKSRVIDILDKTDDFKFIVEDLEKYE